MDRYKIRFGHRTVICKNIMTENTELLSIKLKGQRSFLTHRGLESDRVKESITHLYRSTSNPNPTPGMTKEKFSPPIMRNRTLS